MKKQFILLFIFAMTFALVSSVKAQTTTAIQFNKGASEKTLTITVKANGTNKYSIAVRKNQVINVGIEGDVKVSKTDEFPIISINLNNGVENVDNWQDGEGYLSVLAGRNGKYIVSVFNSDKKRARTFIIKFKVTDDKADFVGGEDVD